MQTIMHIRSDPRVCWLHRAASPVSRSGERLLSATPSPDSKTRERTVLSVLLIISCLTRFLLSIHLFAFARRNMTWLVQGFFKGKLNVCERGRIGERESELILTGPLITDCGQTQINEERFASSLCWETFFSASGGVTGCKSAFVCWISGRFSSSWWRLMSETLGEEKASGIVSGARALREEKYRVTSENVAESQTLERCWQ